MKVFMTGATGVIGSRAVPILLRNGHDVTAVTRSPQASRQFEQSGARVVQVDLFDRSAVARAVAGHDTVINLATHVPRSGTSMFFRSAWKENDRLRAVASATIVDACLETGIERFVQESFAPVYPDRSDQWIDEETPISPVRYNETIVDAEASAQRFTASGRSGVVVRFGAFYGPDSVQTRELIGWIRKGWGPLPGPDTAYISSVSHDDAAAAVAWAVGVPSGIYNVVDDDPVTHRVFVDTLAAAVGVARPKLPPRWITPLMGSVGELLARSVRISNRKLRRSSPWTPRYPSVRDGWPAVVAATRTESNQYDSHKARVNVR
jgi:nucleoside-diphosphate-sugar epimerase